MAKPVELRSVDLSIVPGRLRKGNTIENLGKWWGKSTKNPQNPESDQHVPYIFKKSKNTLLWYFVSCVTLKMHLFGVCPIFRWTSAGKDIFIVDFSLNPLRT
jgi:hypothetical protein